MASSTDSKKLSGTNPKRGVKRKLNSDNDCISVKGLSKDDLRFICAPMVWQSELPFRILCRRYGVTLAYTPMLYAEQVVDFSKRGELSKIVRFDQQDRPLVIQLTSRMPTPEEQLEAILAAGKVLECWCDAVDINLGCPQRIARQGKFGAFMMLNSCLVGRIIKGLVNTLSIPVFGKIRLLPTFEETLTFVQMLEKNGCSLVAIHGRRKEDIKHREGPANMEMIRKIKSQVSIPVILNGNTQCYDDVLSNLEITGCDGVMSATGLLRDPTLFSKSLNERITPSKLSILREYLELSRTYPPPHRRSINRHIIQIVSQKFFEQKAPDLFALVCRFELLKDDDQFIAFLDALEARKVFPADSCGINGRKIWSIQEIKKRAWRTANVDAELPPNFFSDSDSSSSSEDASSEVGSAVGTGVLKNEDKHNVVLLT